MQLGIILTSLQENLHVASLLGFASPLDWDLETTTSEGSSAIPPAQDTHLAEVLMKTLLRNLGYHTVSVVAGVLEFRFKSDFRLFCFDFQLFF